MQSYLNLNNHPTFGASVSDRFIKAVHNYYNGVEYRPYKIKPFEERVKQVFNDFGYDEFTIIYKKEKENGANFHYLYAGNGEYKVLLTKKDKFRKVIDKFMNMNKHELYIKIKQFRQNHPEYRQTKTDTKMS